MIDPFDASAPDSTTQAATARTPGSKRASISDETLAKIRYEIDRSGIGVMRLLRGAQDRPDGLTVQIIDSWLHGRVRSASPDHVTYVINRWAALPTNRLIPLTPEMAEALEAELTRTGMGPVTILKRAVAIPVGLTWQVILSWVNQSTRTVSELHWTDVTRRLSEMPDCSLAAPSSRVGRKERHDISESDLDELRHHRLRTEIGGAILLKNAPYKPVGLSPSMISRWLSGVAKTAKPEHIAYVLMRYRDWP